MLLSCEATGAINRSSRVRVNVEMAKKTPQTASTKSRTFKQVVVISDFILKASI
jgi:hypothetical protein